MLPMIHVVDDDSTSRWLVQEILVDIGGEIRVYEGPLEFLETFRPAPCECLVTDLQMPGMTGLELQERLLEMGATIPVIFISAHSEIPLAVAAVKRGAVDFLEKPVRAALLQEKVQSALAASRILYSKRMVSEDRQARLAELTDREREIVELVLLGKTSREIAELLSISPRTVETHRGRALDKLHATSAIELARLLG